MERSIALHLTAAVWLVNIGVTALAVHGLEHPRPYIAAADVWRPYEPRFKLVEDTKAEVGPEPADDTGIAQMQGAPDVVIGPGTVTHPSTISPRPDR